MYKVELYVRVRRACMVEGMSTREAARVFGLHRDTVRKMLEYSVPPGYRRQSPPRRPKLDPYHGVIDRILEEDRSLPRKQRHTAKRIYERLRAEHGFTGKYTIVKDYVRERRLRTRETRARSRGWWDMLAGTSWCLCRRSRASMRSTPTSRRGAWNGWGDSCVGTTRR